MLIVYCVNCHSKEDGALTVVCVLGDGGKGEVEKMKWREAGRELDYCMCIRSCILIVMERKYSLPFTQASYTHTYTAHTHTHTHTHGAKNSVKHFPVRWNEK